ncbi:uncharacterized protein LOC142524666 [Primulina tabacum]|uniref:uncharacterized protein LOC142524666 n=1 Tax=Primulina tabacum TaxID=48773 RepID=UPI003F593312
MEANACDVNHLDTGSLLPPRKRLLAELKRQNSNVNSHVPSTSSSGVIECDSHLNNMLRSQLINSNLSIEGIVETSRIAATEAAKVAEAARANAEYKAAKAAKAMAAAKLALELVDILSDTMADEEKCLKKYKMKKHVPVQALYSKNKEMPNCRTDEELAHKLHQVINSSPRILKNSSGSDTILLKHKKLKSSFFSNKPSIVTSNSNGVVAEVKTEGPIKEIDIIMVDLNLSKSEKDDQPRASNREEWRPIKTDHFKLKNDEAETLPLKDPFSESMDSIGKKRGRINQKKLPLSLCNIRDQTCPQEKLNLLSVEEASTWKCRAFKTTASVKQNKVMQS